MSRTYLGQNFLVDEKWQKKIASYFEPRGAFMEIGPGGGALTKHLTERFEHFTVMERDINLAEAHKRNPQLRTLVGDFVRWDFCLDGTPVKDFSFIGNLPYESGSLMMQRLCEEADRVAGFVFLLQKEVVERICAQPKTRDFASFTVLVQGQFEVEALDVIPPGAFRPPPKVDSQILRGKRRKEGVHPQDPAYRKFLKQSFLLKRKTARNAWKSFLDMQKIETVFKTFGFSDKVRAEEIEVDLWPQIFAEFRK